MTIMVENGVLPMTKWGATQAKAQFSAMLDKAETEGPQLVRRRKQEFYVLTKEQFAQRRQAAMEENSPGNAWDALRPADDLCFDFDFPRAQGEARAAKF
jgi:PHD/YefM family antitoxin component YafN of YafNO toxin-antitoxin module